MFIVASPAYRGQLVDLAYEDAEGKQKRFMRVLGVAPIEVVDDPKRTDGIPSVVANALVRRSKASIVEVPAAQEPEADQNPESVSTGKSKTSARSEGSNLPTRKEP